MATSAVSESTEGLPLSVHEMAALGAIFEEHRSRLVVIAAGRLSTALVARLDPEEVVNSVFFDARRRWRTFQATKQVTDFVWLYGLVYDRIIEEWRIASRKGLGQNVAWPDRPSIELGMRLVAHDTGPEHAAVRAERAVLMQKAIDQLSTEDREIIMLRDFDDLSYREIGERLGIRYDTANMRHARALLKLKDIWQHLTGESRP